MQALIVNTAGNGWWPGDIVAVQADGLMWGKSECVMCWEAAGGNPADFPNPHLSIVQIETMPPDKNLTESDTELDPTDPDAEQITVRKRGWYLNLDLLSALQLATVGTPGATLPLTRLHASYIRRKSDGLPYPDVVTETDQTPIRRATTTAVPHLPGSQVGLGRLPGV